jgi:hypothetical protein
VQKYSNRPPTAPVTHLDNERHSFDNSRHLQHIVPNRPVLTPMAEALGVAGSIVGVVSLGIQVAQGLLVYYGSWKDQDKEISNMCISLENLLGTLLTLRTTVESLGKFDDMSVREIVEKNIKTIEQGINELSDELKTVLGLGIPKKDLMRRHIRKALYPFKQPTLSKIEQVISQARSNLGISLQTLHL